MGASESKEEKEQREHDESVYDPKYISWDEHGNLRYGLLHPVKRSEQLKEILKRDYVDDEDGKMWYIMDSAWIASWLAYVQFDRRSAPAPGPCNNKRLITYDYHEKKYVGRTGLIMARQDFGGDYRRVSKEVWERFCEYYPESGPAITLVFELKEKNEKGLYDTSKWMILNPPPAPDDATLKKKKKKLITLPLSLKSHNDVDISLESHPTVDPNARDSTSLLSKKSVLADAPNASNIAAMAGSTEGPGVLGESSYAADSDDDIDVSPINSFSGKTKNDPKVVSLNVNYRKVGEEKKETVKENNVKRES